MTELLSKAVNVCPNCGTQHAYYRYDKKYWPWDRVERCSECSLEWVCVGSPEGPGIRVIGVDEIGLRPVCPNCDTGMSFQDLQNWHCPHCGFMNS